MPDPIAPRRHPLCDEASLLRLEGLARAFVRDGTLPPTDGVEVVKARPHRLVVRTEVDGGEGPLRVYVKVHRRTRPFDALRDRLRVAKGPAEAAVLLALAARGVDVPPAVAWSSDGTGTLDLLVTAAMPGRDLRTIAAERPTRRARARIAAAVGRLLRRAHDAGFDDRDVHRGNVLVDGDRAILLDPGTRAPSRALRRRARERALGRAAHGLGADARDGLRALRAYFGDDGRRVRTWARAADRRARRIERRYRAGRARRATRTGRHFGTFESKALVGVRRLDGTPPDVAARLAAWLDAWPAPGAPESPRPLKSDGSVLALRAPGFADEVVAKLYRPRVRDRFRVPRALRAFRRAYALRIRGVACPTPLAAAARPDGTGVAVFELLRDGEGDAVDLDRAVRGRGGAPAPYATLPRGLRREALFELGRFLRRMHDAEVSHRDLKAPNLVARREDGRVTFALVDLEGARVRRGPVAWRRRARDLGRLDASVGPVVTRADRRRVLAGYFAAFRRAPTTPAAFARRAAAASARKRGPSGAPR